MQRVLVEQLSGAAWRGIGWRCRQAPSDTRHLEQRRTTDTLRCIFVRQPHCGDVERKKEILALSVDRHITLQDFSSAPGTISGL